MKQSKYQKEIQVGDHVTFDSDKVEIFKAETDNGDNAIQQYRRLVLAGVDQIGVVKASGANLTTVTYPDGWELPVPTKYLVVLPEQG